MPSSSSARTRPTEKTNTCVLTRVTVVQSICAPSRATATSLTLSVAQAAVPDSGRGHLLSRSGYTLHRSSPDSALAALHGHVPSEVTNPYGIEDARSVAWLVDMAICGRLRIMPLSVTLDLPASVRSAVGEKNPRPLIITQAPLVKRAHVPSELTS